LPNAEALLSGVGDAALGELAKTFRRDPNVWTLATLAARLREQGARELAASAFRVAAGLFAYQGLMVQALVVHDRAGTLLADQQWQADILAISTLPASPLSTLQAYMERVDSGGFYKLLQESELDLPADGAFLQPDARRVPMLGTLSAQDLLALMRRTRVRRYSRGTTVIREGDIGDTLYAIGEGRVVVWCSAPESLPVEGGRINISSLSDGDFFGEFGFLVGGARSASVETVVDSYVLEVDRGAVRDLMHAYPQMGDALMDFYKQRVVELLMARNPVFALLSPDDRRALLARATLVECEDDQVVIEEGTAGDAFFFIKRGEVEVFGAHKGLPVFINKLREGEFFGEIAVLRRVPRTAGVRAMGKVELLRIGGGDLWDILGTQPQLRQFLDRAIEKRMHEAEDQRRTALELLG
jgi:CRP-like cAMP-binding protein